VGARSFMQGVVHVLGASLQAMLLSGYGVHQEWLL
jgi:hypothetical protein